MGELLDRTKGQTRKIEGGSWVLREVIDRKERSGCGKRFKWIRGQGGLSREEVSRQCECYHKPSCYSPL